MSQPVAFIEGRVKHKTNNALQITFRNGPGDPLAVGTQGAGSWGKKLGVLLGFKNGGVGDHELRFADGTTVVVGSRSGAPSEFRNAGGAELATVQRGESAVATLGGRELVRFVPDPDDPAPPDLYRMRISTPSGEIGALDVIRRAGGWSVLSAIDSASNYLIWMDRAGEALPIPILGTRLRLTAPVPDELRAVLLAACVDIAVGLRPYTSAMS